MEPRVEVEFLSKIQALVQTVEFVHTVRKLGYKSSHRPLRQCWAVQNILNVGYYNYRMSRGIHDDHLHK